MNKGLPFSVNIPNKTTEETFKKTDREEEMVSCQSAEDMFDKLEDLVGDFIDDLELDEELEKD